MEDRFTKILSYCLENKGSLRANGGRNKKTIKALEKRKSSELRTNYIVQLLIRRSNNLSYKEMAEHSEMIEAMRSLVLLKREIKMHEREGN